MIYGKLGVLVIIGTLLLSACTEEKNEQKIEDKLSVKEEVIDDPPSVELTLFELSPKEKEVYNNFQKDFNLKHLSGLDPVSVAKLYVQAGFDKNYDVKYALYTDREEYVLWSKEEDESIPESDRGSKEQYIKQFRNIDKGTFIQTSDDGGYIEYDTGEGTMGFKMIKNADGTWQVSFLPIQ